MYGTVGTICTMSVSIFTPSLARNMCRTVPTVSLVNTSSFLLHCCFENYLLSFELR